MHGSELRCPTTSTLYEPQDLDGTVCTAWQQTSMFPEAVSETPIACANDLRPVAILILVPAVLRLDPMTYSPRSQIYHRHASAVNSASRQYSVPLLYAPFKLPERDGVVRFGTATFEISTCGTEVTGAEPNVISLPSIPYFDPYYQIYFRHDNHPSMRMGQAKYLWSGSVELILTCLPALFEGANLKRKPESMLRLVH